MNLDRVNSSRMGVFLPKEIGKTQIVCKDVELKEKLEELVDLMLEKLDIYSGKDYCDWDIEDYKLFRKQISNLFVSTYSEFSHVLIWLLHIPKDKLEEQLRNYDKMLDLHVFDDKRNIKPVKKIVKNSDGTEQVISTNEYFYTKHVFTIADIVDFIRGLYSKRISYESIILKKYEMFLDKDKSIDFQIEEIKVLLNSLREENVQLIDVIKDEYMSWIKELSEDDKLRLFLVDQFNKLIDGNKLALADKLVYLQQAHIRDYKNYAITREEELLAFKAVYNKRKYN